MIGPDSGDLVRRAESRVGTQINGKWTIDRLIGVGGMAAVYAATHRNKKRAAIKMLHPTFSIDAQVRARFLREGYLANSVEHPGAVRVDDDDVADDGAAFLVMELLDGESAEARRTREGGRLPVSEASRIADQLLDVLAAAHEKGIVHRDLKPDNLFLDRAGQVKVLDFGIARLREMRELASATQTGSLMGTPAFMAPEQARGRWDQVDARTDLWAVGATLFTLLTGRFVHEAETANETLALAITQAPRSIVSLLPELDTEVAKVIDRALAYDKANRYENALAMQQALRASMARRTGRSSELSLLERPVSLVAGQSSSARNSGIAAQSEASASAVGPLVPTLTTGALTTALGTPVPRSASRRRVVLVAAVGGVLLAAVVGVTASMSSRTDEARAEANAPSALPPAPIVAPNEIAVTPVVSPTAPIVPPVSAQPEREISPDTQPSARSRGQVPRPRGKIGPKNQAGRPASAASAAPVAATAETPAPVVGPKRDPFSKRQ